MKSLCHAKGVGLCALAALLASSVGCSSSDSRWASLNPFGSATPAATTQPAVVSQPAASQLAAAGTGLASSASGLAQGVRGQANTIGMTTQSAWGKTKGAVAGVFSPLMGATATTVADGQDASGDPLRLSNKQTAPPEVFVLNGQVWEAGGSLDRAMENYAKAIAAEPTNAPALAAMARLHWREERFDRAVEFFERAAQSAPEDATVQNDLGLAYSKVGRHPEAVAAVQNARKLKPTGTHFANNLASVQFAAGAEQEALATLRQANPPAVAHFNMAQLYLHAQRLEPAREQLGHALAQESSGENDTATERALQLSRQLLAKLDGPVNHLARAGSEAARLTQQASQAASQVAERAGALSGDLQQPGQAVRQVTGDGRDNATETPEPGGTSWLSLPPSG